MTVAGYNIEKEADELRKIYARTPEAKAHQCKAGDFSYNTGKLRCPICDGTGSISLDVQFLPDVEITCPDCGGSRYQKDAAALYRTRKDGTQAESLPRLMEMSVDDALAAYGAQLDSTLRSSAMSKLPASKIVNATSANSANS